MSLSRDWFPEVMELRIAVNLCPYIDEEFLAGLSAVRERCAVGECLVRIRDDALLRDGAVVFLINGVRQAHFYDVADAQTFRTLTLDALEHVLAEHADVVRTLFQLWQEYAQDE